MSVKTILILFSAGLIFLLVGCGVSTADIDATVEARIASIPTPTPTPTSVIPTPIITD